MARRINAQQFEWIAWGITGFMCWLALVVFGDSIRWDLGRLSAYRLFPLFGLLAYSIFLSHYIVSTIRQILDVDKSAVKTYFEATSWIALGVLLLHPSLLIVRLWIDGFGLPPSSYLEEYVAESLKWAAVLGTLSFLLFLSYELTRFVKFARYKPLLQALSDIAMILIFIHGLALGSHLQSGWFKGVWLVYGLLLVLCLLYTYVRLLSGKVTKAKE